MLLTKPVTLRSLIEKNHFPFLFSFCKSSINMIALSAKGNILYFKYCQFKDDPDIDEMPIDDSQDALIDAYKEL